MNIKEAIKDLTDRKIIVKREFKSFSFGDFETCKRALEYTFKLMDSTADYEWLPEYDEVCNWLSNTEGKGLFLTGSCGRGKSTIITASIPALFLAKFNKCITPKSARDLRVDDYVNSAFYCIDEVGVEPIVSDYGSKSYPFMYYVDKAESLIKPMLLSTNMSANETEEKYDYRTLERITRLCKIIKFEGESKRK